MKNMTLSAIAEAVHGKLHIAESENANKEATCVVLDSRLIEAGGIFVATKGERVDGHTFIPQVMDKGALAVICEDAPDEKYSYIKVEDSFVALKLLAKYYRAQLDVKVVGIIGSVGKTSTKEIVSAVLSEKYNVLKTQGNFNNEVGVPLTLCRIRDEHQVAVVEMGISDFGEMSRLADIARPDAVVMTNIGPCHLENLGDLDGVLKAKTEVFNYMKDGSPIVLNKDDAKLGGKLDTGNLKVIYYGSGSDYYADKINNLGLKGTSFELKAAGKTADTQINMPGIHMVTNALAAAAIAYELGLSIGEIANGISKAQSISGRSNLIETKEFLVIDDCYNANPKSMKSALDLMKSALGRKVAILGDMFELGLNEAELHSEIGVYAVNSGIDLLICVGNISKNMYDAAVSTKEQANANSSILYYEKKEDLLNDLKDNSRSVLRSGDTVLIKASHGMGFAEIVDYLKLK